MSMMVAAGQSAPITGDLCAQNPNWKNEVCGHIRNIATSNRALFLWVKVKEMQGISTDRFQDPRNVTSIDSFYGELVKYKATLNGLHSSLKAYMRTPLFSTESVIPRDKNFTEKYQERITAAVTDLEQTIDKLSELVVRPTDPLENNSQVGSEKSSRVIYGETFYVTGKLAALLTPWQDKCDKC